MKLFAIYIGGEHPAAHIEIHDVRFAVAESIKDTHAQLRAEWWGSPGTLHIDCWAEIAHADGCEVTLRPEPFFGPERIFFVNLGGYDGRDFAEQHKNMFVVATSAKHAKARQGTPRHAKARQGTPRHARSPISPIGRTRTATIFTTPNSPSHSTPRSVAGCTST